MNLARPAALAALLAPASPALAQDAPRTPGGQEALAMLREAIAVPTVKGAGKVPELAGKFAARLEAAGFARGDIAFVPIGETGYFTARYPGRDRKARPILLLGHMDVVVARREDWQRDPFTPVVENGYVYGRGALDNKGDVAMIVAAVAGLRREGWKPARDIVIAFSGDEETDMTTTAAMAQALKGAGLALNGDVGGGDLAPDGKPMVYSLQAGEKTYADFPLTLTDPGGHASRPGASNAIARMGAALARIWEHRFAPQVSPLTRAYWLASADSAPDGLGASMRALAANPADRDAAEKLSARPEYVGLVRTTCVPTLVNGGHAPNALPQRVTATVNCRIFPGTATEDVRSVLRQVAGDSGIDVGPADAGAVEAPESPLDPRLLAALRKALAERAPGLAIVPSMSAGASDSSHFRALGVPSYGVSATFLRAEDDFAHGLNERLPLATLDPGVRQWQLLLKAIAR